MTDPTDPTVTAALLERWSGGDPEAFDILMTQLYRDIHAIAVRELRGERHATIQPTALVHEVYLRLNELREMRWQDRAHFLSMAALIARRALVDEARRRRADKHNGGTPVTLSDENLGGVSVAYDALDVDSLITELSQYDAEAAEIVALRVFGGLSIEETAQAVKLSVATVNRRWSIGKTWLARELTRET